MVALPFKGQKFVLRVQLPSMQIIPFQLASQFLLMAPLKVNLEVAHIHFQETPLQSVMAMSVLMAQ